MQVFCYTKLVIFNVPATPKVLRIVDYLMLPLMLFLGGFQKDSIQETHPWHLWRRFKINDIDQNKTLPFTGQGEKLKSHFLFLFHAPIFGGWKKYIVLQPTNYSGKYRVGWVVYRNGKQKEASIHKLLINNSPARLLSGSEKYSGYFFAIDASGRQIELEIAGKGVLGDNNFPGTRLL